GSGGSSGSDADADPESSAEVIGDTPVAGVIDSADEEEQLFAFAAPSDGVYTIALNWPEPASDLDLFITDGDASYFTLSANNNTESINVDMAQGDLLAIAVNAFQTNGSQTFTIGAAATAQPPHSPGHVESEPNDDVPTGNIIGFGQGSGIVSYDFDSMSGLDRDDTFIYVAPEAATYTVLLTWTNNQRDLDMAIGWDSGTAASAQSGTESESITQALNADEQLRVLVRAYDTDNVPVSYNLTIEAQ
ncbi:MAG: hypothetical protein OEN20_09285, partial [Gammaproteobacteria bacterium]|nr:hypothetical protein [Gammaproteobacteria bacterium]